MKIMAVDYGSVRTGVAFSDLSGTLATPAGYIEERDSSRLSAKLTALAIENRAEEIVVGLPRHMNGSEGESAQRARELAEQLSALLSIPVILRDERLSTADAHRRLNQTTIKGKKRRQVIDSMAATLILQEYLDFR